MGWFQRFKDLFKKYPKSRSEDSHELTEEDLQQSQRTRSMQNDIKRMNKEIMRLDLEYQLEERKARLEELKSELYGDEPESDDGDIDLTKLLITMFATFMMQKQQGNTSLPTPGGVGDTTPNNSPVAVHFTDEQLVEFKKQIPNSYLKLAKKMPPEQIRNVIESKVGKIDDDTFQRAMNMLK